MAKFCGKCGTRLDEATGLCPNCNADKMIENQNGASKHEENNTIFNLPPGKRELKKAKESRRASKKKTRRNLPKIFICVLLVIILISGIVCSLVYFDVVDIPVVGEALESIGLKKVKYADTEEINYDKYKVEPPDADEYFQKNSQIIEEIKATDSDEVLTEKKVTKILAERGFKEFPIISGYNMDGIYSNPDEISKSSSVKHPLYTMYYITQNNALWNIMIINDSVMAIPVSYNAQSSLGVQLVISESKEVTSYDSTTNKFYKTIPNESVMIVKVVERIDMETLENLTIEVMETL